MTPETENLSRPTEVDQHPRLRKERSYERKFIYPDSTYTPDYGSTIPVSADRLLKLESSVKAFVKASPRVFVEDMGQNRSGDRYGDDNWEEEL